MYFWPYLYSYSQIFHLFGENHISRISIKLCAIQNQHFSVKLHDYVFLLGSKTTKP